MVLVRCCDDRRCKACLPSDAIDSLLTAQTRLKATVYVAGLDHAVNEKILADAFIPFGNLVDVTLPKPDLPSSTDPHRGFGYVEFESLEDAREAIDNMDQSEIFGRVVKVAQAKPQKNVTESLGSKTAVWEQEGYLAKHAVREEERLEDGYNKSVEPDTRQDVEALDTAGPRQI